MSLVRPLLEPFHILAFVLPLAIGVASGAPRAAGKDIVTIYSNICYHDESGDLFGDRILIIDSYGDKFAVYQPSTGWIQPPEPVKTKIEGDRIELSSEGPSGGVVFTGKLTDKAIVGRFGYAPDKIVRLSRQPNIVQPVRDCK